MIIVIVALPVNYIENETKWLSEEILPNIFSWMKIVYFILIVLNLSPIVLDDDLALNRWQAKLLIYSETCL